MPCDPDAADGDADQGGDLEEFETDRAAGGVGEPGRLEAGMEESFEQHIAHGGELQAELVGPHRRGRGVIPSALLRAAA